MSTSCPSTPCRADPEAFTDDGHGSSHRRPRAARLCFGCPVLALCNTYAESAGEEHHVWGGVDRTEQTRAVVEDARPAEARGRETRPGV